MDFQIDLLDFDFVEVFYVTWRKQGRSYFLKDMTPDACHIQWTPNQSNALYFYSEKEAQKCTKHIKRLRPGVRTVKSQVNIIDELDFEI